MTQDESVKYIEKAIIIENNKYQKAYLNKEDFQARKDILIKIRALEHALASLKASLEA